MIFFMILAPLLFNLTGLIDTYLTKLFWKEQSEGTIESSTWTLMIIWGSIALLVAVALLPFLWNQIFSIGIKEIWIILLAGGFYGIATYPYFHALKSEKIENIIPMLQAIPIFSYIIAGILLWESMSTRGIVLMGLSVLVAILFGWNFWEKKINYKGILLIFASCILFSLYNVTFKLWTADATGVWISYFWQHLWIATVSLAFLLNKSIRKTSFRYFKTKWIWFSILNIGNEIFFIVGMALVSYLTLFYDIAFVKTLTNWLQPVLWFVMVFLAYKFLPNIYEWKYSKKELIWKVLLCIISFLLLFIFYTVS